MPSQIPLGRCLGVLPEALSGISSGLPFGLPDPARLGSVATVSGALREALPGMPEARLHQPRTLVEELRWWAGRRGERPPEPLPALPGDVRRALAWLLGGARQAEALRSAAVSASPFVLAAAAEALQRPFVVDRSGRARLDGSIVAVARGVDLAGLQASAAVLAASADRAMAELAGGRSDGPCDGDPTEPQEIGGLVAVDAAGTRTIYKRPYVVSLDLGGCDEYRNAAGGGFFSAGLAIDVGSHDDLYVVPPETFALGGAQIGLGVLVDDGGDDIYRTTGFGDLGTGIVGGVGLFADLGGDDVYDAMGSGGGYGSQGVGTLGVGAMIDPAGDDRYSYRFDPGAASPGLIRILQAQGSAIAGTGVLADGGGRDTYLASATASAILLGQGSGFGQLAQGTTTGLLLDADGDDAYSMGVTASSSGGESCSPFAALGVVHGQGSGIFYGAGVLLEGAGDDTYRIEASVEGTTGATAGVGGQGFGDAKPSGPVFGVFPANASVGLLADLGGDDAYSSSASAAAEEPCIPSVTEASQGAANNQALGVLVDLEGNDSYQHRASAPNGVESSAGQGAATLGATAVLADRRGNDSYTGGSRSQGYGAGGRGLLLDGAGRNRFSGPGADPALWVWVRGDGGVGLDGGRGGEVALNTIDEAIRPLCQQLGICRPHPLPTVSITAPGHAAVVHGDVTVAGAADGGPIGVDAVEWRFDEAPWILARKGETWATWSDLADVDGLADGKHVVWARAWASGLDSWRAARTIYLERWDVSWETPSSAGPGPVELIFRLATRGGAPVDSSQVTLSVLSPSGEGVASFGPGLSEGGGRYVATWQPPAPGTYTLRVELPGEVLGMMSIEVRE